MLDYLRLVLGLPFYQVILSFAAARAAVRVARGANSWEKTTHLGLHLAPIALSGDTAAGGSHGARDIPRRRRNSLATSNRGWPCTHLPRAG